MASLKYFNKQSTFISVFFNILISRSKGSILPISTELSYSELSELRDKTGLSNYGTSRKRPEIKVDNSHHTLIDDEYNEDYLIIYHDLNSTKDIRKCLFSTKTSRCVYNITDDDNLILKEKITLRSKRFLRPDMFEEYIRRHFFDNSPMGKHEDVPQPKLAPQLLIDEIEYYIKYAGGSYCEMNSEDNSKCSYCKYFDKESVILPIVNKTTGMHAIMVALPLRREIVIAYRGSDKTYKLFYSMSEKSVEFPGVKKTKVHKYFYDSVISLQKDIAEGLNHLLGLYPEYKIVLTGHSLGGGLATLAAPLIHRDLFIPYSQFRVITYGQLRIGNVEFANWYNELNINFTRVVNGYDEATNTPVFSIDWVHVKQEVHIVDNQYYVCETTLLEHPQCSFRKTWLIGLLTDHESVGNIGLSPRHCKDSFYFFKVKFGF